ncbi:MAG TPA: nucleotide exchange factor GrpE [Acidobacteriota bacterium]|nr:nucleotide exchange factor GrpE [Acidobacteriota bacterium]
MKKMREEFQIDEESDAGESAADASSEELFDPGTGRSPEGELGRLRAERDEYKDLLLRKQAEFENFRKRTQKERVEARLDAQAEIIRELLLVVDACEKGLESLPAEATADPVLATFQEGYQLLLKQLQALLQRFNVSEVAGVGSAFDPNVHEAVVSEEDSQRAEGEVLEEYRKGYLIGERLLRPAQVKVSVNPGREAGHEGSAQQGG